MEECCVTSVDAAKSVAISEVYLKFRYSLTFAPQLGLKNGPASLPL